jgi:hypothetical protein
VRQVQGAHHHHQPGRARGHQCGSHSYGGVVLHDVINNAIAHKAIEKGADGLIAVAAGAGGHAGVKSPFALVQEIRQWFDGPLALSGAISTGDAVLAAQAMGADFAYIGSAFIATDEARAADAYKQAIVDSNSDDIVYSNLFTGVHGNYLKPSIRAAGWTRMQLPESDPSKMNFGGDARARPGRTSGAVARGLVPSAKFSLRETSWPSSNANTPRPGHVWRFNAVLDLRTVARMGACKAPGSHRKLQVRQVQTRNQPIALVGYWLAAIYLIANYG